MSNGMKQTNKMFQLEVKFQTEAAKEFITNIRVRAGNATQAKYQGEHLLRERYHESFGATLGEAKIVKEH